MNADEIIRILDELGRRLGPTGEYVFGLAVRQVVIDGALAVVAFAVVLSASIILMRYIVRRHDECGCGSLCGWEMIGIVVGLVAGTASICVGAMAVFALSRLLNPEYAALRDVLDAIGR
jgi:hypothetical protein